MSPRDDEKSPLLPLVITGEPVKDLVPSDFLLRYLLCNSSLVNLNDTVTCDFMQHIGYLPKTDFSTLLKAVYNMKATAEPTKIPISPVPEFAIGPVYHTCDMHGMITPNAPKNAQSAASPGGRREGLSHMLRSYEWKRPLLKIKCSVRAIAANTHDQYPMIPVYRSDEKVS